MTRTRQDQDTKIGTKSWTRQMLDKHATPAPTTTTEPTKKGT